MSKLIITTSPLPPFSTICESGKVIDVNDKLKKDRKRKKRRKLGVKKNLSKTDFEKP